MATKATLEGFSPEFTGCFRLALAAALFRVLGGPEAQWFVADRWMWIAGVALGADFIFYNYGLQRTSANVAGLVINVELVSTIALAVWLLGERLNAQRVVGSLVTLAGVLVVTFENLHLGDLAARERAFGNALVMAAGVAWSLYAVAQHRAPRRYGLFQRLTPIFSVAALTTAPMLCQPAAWHLAPDLRSSVMLVILTLLCTGLVYFIYARAQQLIDVSVLAVLLSSIPIFAIVLAYVLLAEPLTPRLLAGTVIVVAGIVIIAAEKHGAGETAAFDAEPISP